MEETQNIKQVTLELFEKLGFNVSAEILPEGDGYFIQITTEDEASMLIGRHARMLASLQRVLAAMIFKSLGKHMDVLLDINDYRAGQKERLQNIARNVAQRVVDENRAAQLSSFSPYERRIIHEFISENYTSLSSFSTGEGKDRVLVIDKKA